MSTKDIVPSSCDHSPSPAESWRARFGRIILSRPVGILAGSLMLMIFLGCMSLSIGCKTGADGTTCQEGKVNLREKQEMDVYYPVPYSSPPNLEICGDSNDCEILEQKADHFRIRYSGSLFAKPQWKACGQRCLPGAAPTVVVTPPSPPPVPPPTNGPPTPLPPPTPLQTP